MWRPRCAKPTSFATIMRIPAPRACSKSSSTRPSAAPGSCSRPAARKAATKSSGALLISSSRGKLPAAERKNHRAERILIHFTIRSRIGLNSLDQFDLARPPRFGEERFERAVEAQDRKKSFPGHGLDPVASFDPCRLGRTEVDRRGAVSIRFGGGRREALAASTRIALWCVEHRARLVIVKRERPEVRLRNVLWQ